MTSKNEDIGLSADVLKERLDFLKKKFPDGTDRDFLVTIKFCFYISQRDKGGNIIGLRKPTKEEMTRIYIPTVNEPEPIKRYTAEGANK